VSARLDQTRCPHCQAPLEAGGAAWNHRMRGETELQSVDRQFSELLQELRVAQTGVQILFAFLLGLAFTPRFPDLTGAQQGVYLVTLVLSAVSAALLIGPVGYHRTVFRQRLRPQLVTTGHRYAVAGLVLLLLALVGAVQLAASFVLGPWAAILAAALAGLFATLWFVVPLLERVRHQRYEEEPENAASAAAASSARDVSSRS
jgi:Family of unknown function (DUF6328)